MTFQRYFPGFDLAKPDNWSTAGHGPFWAFVDTADRGATRVADNRAAVEAPWKAYVNKLLAAWNEYDTTIANWRLSASELHGLIPPAEPASAPDVAADSFTATAAPGSAWEHATAVSYAASFASTRGPSTRGPWSEAYPTGGKAGPLLIDIPVDPLGLATARQIWRRFDDGKTTQPPRVVGAILDNTTTVYRDTT